MKLKVKMSFDALVKKLVGEPLKKAELCQKKNTNVIAEEKDKPPCKQT